MAWLRIDDGFAFHPKIASLSDRNLRVWLRVLCYCAAYKTRGALPPSAKREIAGLTVTLLRQFTDLRLLDPDPDPEVENQEMQGSLGYVHDWKVYNPDDATASERMRRYRNKHRNDTVTENVTGTVTVTDPRARAGAPVPVPSPYISQQQQEEQTASAAADFERIGWAPEQVARALGDLERASAWLERSRHRDIQRPGAYAWHGFQAGGWPEKVQAPKPLSEWLRSLVEQSLWQYPDDSLRDELEVRARKRDEQIPEALMDELLSLAATLRDEQKLWDAEEEVA